MAIEFTAHQVHGYRLRERSLSSGNNLVDIVVVNAKGETLTEITLFGGDAMPKMLPWSDE